MKPRKLLLLLLACLLLALAGSDGEGWSRWEVIGFVLLCIAIRVLGAAVLGSLTIASKKPADIAIAQADEGDSSVESRIPIRLSPESISAIQERFADDEELAALVAQLGDASEEEYEEVLSQVEEHIGSRLEQDGPQEG